jgi:LCP family protein required for cell wall assembly
VRTTLKRGIGRGATGNGNGHPVLPPSALTPVSIYQQPPPRRRTPLQVAGRIVLWVTGAVVMLAVALAGGAYLFFHQSVAAVAAHSVDVKRAEKALAVPLPGHAAIALIVGYDHRANEGANVPSRSDTIMLLRADPSTKTISMLSFPRDMIVPVVCPGHSTFHARINAAYAECGSQGTLNTVKALTGLPVNYLITVNFHGFKEIVDTLGGVWLDIDRRYFNNNAGVTPGYGYATINLQPGYQKLDGGRALDFVRYRHTDSDFYRVARQQLFVKALKQQIRHAFSPLALPRIIGSIARNVEVGQGGGSAISGRTILSYALFAYELPPGHFYQPRIDGLTGYGELHADPSSIQTAVQAYLNPDVKAPENATNVALGIKPKVKTLAPADVTVTVLNGNGVTGSASTAGYLLGQRGYRVVVPANGHPANAPRFDYFRSQVYFDRTQAGAHGAATKLALLVGSADVAPLPRDLEPLSNGAALVVTVGSTFHGTLAPAPVDQTPTREPAAVVSDAAATEPLLRAVRRKVPFKLMVPYVVEHYSRPDYREPLRVYKIQKQHRAVRIVFRNGGNEYWGIEETDWTDAPVLNGPNFSRRIAGRHYDLYYSGPHLHMIVLRARGASYWVVNTLLDTLSNETMLAIAKGLHPLGK